MSKASLQLTSLENPYYQTETGSALLGDSDQLLRNIPDGSVNLIVTSPPFALTRKKEYGNVEPDEYLDWFMPFTEQFSRILAEDGSLVIHIGGAWNKGEPTRSVYHFELLIALCRAFHLAQDFYWYNPARLPSPAEWVNVRRIRVKDAVEPIWWLSKSPYPKADNRQVLKPYSDSMRTLLKNGYRAKRRPSGHDISSNFNKDHGGAIPPNLLSVSHTESNSHYLRRCREERVSPHPARYPTDIPEFFVRFLTEEGDLVVDPFAGSNTTGATAQRLGRRWIAIEIVEDYLKGSKFRFEELQASLI